MKSTAFEQGRSKEWERTSESNPSEALSMRPEGEMTNKIARTVILAAGVAGFDWFESGLDGRRRLEQPCAEDNSLY